MTPSRIKAIRFFLKETPHEFAFRLRREAYYIALLENGSKTPDDSDLTKLARAENLLILRGKSLETINEREKIYET